MWGVERIMTGLRSSRILVGLAAMALTVAALAVAPGVAAAGGSTTSDKADGAGEHHCSVSLSTGTARCFGTIREAIAQATAGRVTDGSLSASTGTADSKTTARLDSGELGVTSLVIGIEYYWQDFNHNPDGSVHQPDYTLTYSGNVSCTIPTSDLDYRAAPMPNYAPPAGTTINWNNNIRAFQGFNGCYQRMWDNANCTGLLFDYAPSAADLAAAPAAGRDQTECIDWS
jgi:hypothetical protein